MSTAYGTVLPQATITRDQPARRSARLLTVSGPRPRTAVAGVGVVLVLTFIGLFYLSQTFEAAAARYRVDALLVERDAMLRELKSQQGATVMWGSEATVTQWAQGAGLDRLGTRLRVRAR